MITSVDAKYIQKQIMNHIFSYYACFFGYERVCERSLHRSIIMVPLCGQPCCVILLARELCLIAIYPVITDAFNSKKLIDTPPPRLPVALHWVLSGVRQRDFHKSSFCVILYVADGREGFRFDLDNDGKREGVEMRVGGLVWKSDVELRLRIVSKDVGK